MAYSAIYNVTIQAPPSKVFDYIADISRHGEWADVGDKMSATAEHPGPPAVGARYKAEGVSFGSSAVARPDRKVVQSVVTVTAYEPPNRIAFDAENSNSVFHHEFLCTPAGGGTQVERRVTMTRGPIHFPIVLSIFKGIVQKNYNGAMSNLKAKLESGA